MFLIQNEPDTDHVTRKIDPLYFTAGFVCRLFVCLPSNIIQLSIINRPKISFVQAEKWIEFMSALNIPYRKVTFKVVSSLV